jgi:catechol-2,3-dioxygenase
MGTFELAFTVIPVRDLQRAADFYHGALGLPFDEKPVSGGGLRLSGSPVALEQQAASVTDGQMRHAHLAFRVQDLRAEYGRLVKRHVKFHSAPLEHDDRWTATALDPDGNEIDLIEYKAQARIVVTPETVVNDVMFPHPETMEVFEDHSIRICGGCLVLLNAPVRETAEYSGLNRSESAQLVQELNQKLEEIAA